MNNSRITQILFKPPTEYKKEWFHNYIRLLRSVWGWQSHHVLRIGLMLEEHGLDYAIKWMTEFEGPPKPQGRKKDVDVS